ncbi:MAG: hypothetical protein ABI760_03405 [Ferruginibacter sp.]
MGTLLSAWRNKKNFTREKFRITLIAGINQSGKWVEKRGSENSDQTNLSCREFVFSSDIMSLANLNRAIRKINPPSCEGKGSKKDSFGKAVKRVHSKSYIHHP